MADKIKYGFHGLLSFSQTQHVQRYITLLAQFFGQQDQPYALGNQGNRPAQRIGQVDKLHPVELLRLKYRKHPFLPLNFEKLPQTYP